MDDPPDAPDATASEPKREDEPAPDVEGSMLQPRPVEIEQDPPEELMERAHPF